MVLHIDQSAYTIPSFTRTTLALHNDSHKNSKICGLPSEVSINIFSARSYLRREKMVMAPRICTSIQQRLQHTNCGGVKWLVACSCSIPH